jgi:hypothetical protein
LTAADTSSAAIFINLVVGPAEAAVASLITAPSASMSEAAAANEFGW